MENKHFVHTFDATGFQLQVDHQRGGKVTSVFDRKIRRNLLLEESATGQLRLEDNAIFSLSGWDEAIPSLEPCEGVPTLGHAWRTAPICRLRSNGVDSHWTLPSWDMQRQIIVDESGVTATYRIVNRGRQPQRLIWAAHVLYPLKGLRDLTVPGRAIFRGPNCRADEVERRFKSVGSRRKTSDFESANASWKFFVRADDEVLLTYGDAVLSITTDAPWYGIWLNVGQYGVRCVGVEPTNQPTDCLQDVVETIPVQEKTRFRWRLWIQK